MDYAKLIKKYREKQLITQEEFANLLGVSFSTVNRWENGKYEPTMKVKRKLKELLLNENLWEEDSNE